MRRSAWYAIGTVAVLLLGWSLLSPTWPGALRSPSRPPELDDAANRPQDDLPGDTANTALPRASGEGGQILSPRLEDGVKVFDLAAQRVQWQVAPDKWVEAWTYNGTVPGPQIRVNYGDRVRLQVRNELPEPTTVHWHGQVLPWGQDGVPGLTQPAIRPGETFTYEFAAKTPGTHWYHTHFNTAKQITMGLYGPMITEPGPEQPHIAYDREFTTMIGDAGELGLTMNGRSYPLNQPMMVRQGERVLLRMINNGVGPHPMHLHGHVAEVVAKNGHVFKEPFHADTVEIAAGESYDLLFVADNPGAWVFHCHIPTHAEGPNGMFGLTQELRYLDAPGLPPVGAAATHDGRH